MKPITRLSVLHRPIANKALPTSSLSRALIHQHLGHRSDRKLDLMRRLQTLHGLPKCPFLPTQTICPICVKAKFMHPPKGKTLDTSHLTCGEYLHIDFSFWNIPSIRHFTGMLVIIDASTRMLWLFCTSSKRPPMHIISYFFDILQKEKCCVKTLCIDEEGSLTRNAEFTSYLIHHHITLDTTGGYSSFLNDKVERPHQTIAQLVRAMLINSGHSTDTWCYCAEHAADIYGTPATQLYKPLLIKLGTTLNHLSHIFTYGVALSSLKPLRLRNLRMVLLAVILWALLKVDS